MARPAKKPTDSKPATTTTTKTNPFADFDPFAPTAVERLTDSFVNTTVESMELIEELVKTAKQEVVAFRESRARDIDFQKKVDNFKALQAQASFDEQTK